MVPAVPVIQRVARQRRADGALRDRDGSAREFHRHDGVLVDARLADARHRRHRRRRAEHEVRQLHRVAPEVEERAAAERGIEQPVVGLHLGAEAEGALDAEDLADGLVVEQRPQGPVRGEETAPERLHREAPAPGGELGDARRFLLVDGERLLAEHVLARLERERHVGGVAGVGRRHVDDVDSSSPTRSS